MEKKNFAYETYKNVEASSNFNSPKDRILYQKALLERTLKKEIPFLSKHFPKRFFSVLEIGSGSGRILHALLMNGLAKEALGIEISPSRVAFAKAWAKELKLSARHTVGNILHKVPIEKFDAVLCLTSIYPFFDLLEKNGLRKVLRNTRELLNPTGHIVLETVTFAKEIEQCNIAGGSVQVWEEYSKGDPFRFNLVHYEWDKKKRYLNATSYNVMRNNLFVDGPTIKKWHMQTASSLRSLLLEEGYKDIHFYGEFDSSRYIEGKSHRCIVIAKT